MSAIGIKFDREKLSNM